jgi:hypothetical protein
MLDMETQVDSVVVEVALRHILESSIFRSSKQCQLLLRYIIKNSLAHQNDLLRERVIGAEVFGRSPDYDTGNDPIVRARVSEVRKRLAQYYLEYREDTQLFISIPSGSYRAVFFQEERPPFIELIDEVSAVNEKTMVYDAPRHLGTIEELPETRTNQIGRQAQPRERRLWISISLSIVVVVAIVFVGVVVVRQYRQNRTTEITRRFWQPLANGTKPSIIYVGANYSYRLSGDFLNSYRAAHQLEDTGPEIPVVFGPADKLSGKDLISTHRFTGFGDVAAAAHIVAFLTKNGEKYDLRCGDDIAPTDLHASPVILVGGFSNQWTMQLTHDLRYTLAQGNKIIDHNDKTKVWQVDPQNDYAVISRLVHSQTASFVLSSAGIGTGGTQAGAEFITNPEQLAKVLEKAPAGWERKNMQIVLHANVLHTVPVSTDIQAVYFW